MITQDSLFETLIGAPSHAWAELGSNEDIVLILQTPPDGFPLRNRRFWSCAHHSLKAVIEAKQGISKPMKAYSSNWWSRLTYLMTPWWIGKVLKKHNLEYEVIKAKRMGEVDKLMLLKEKLKRWPIILLVANGQTRRNWFSLRRALFHWHYITLWWYHDKEKMFFVYDSNTRRDTEQYLMKGTIKVPYKYILREWWIGATKLLYNYAIAVEY